MKFKINYISKKKLKEMLAETAARNYDLANTNKILKNYIRYLKKKNQRETTGCFFCDGKIRWVHDFGDNRYAIYYCPRCGRKIPWPED